MGKRKKSNIQIQNDYLENIRSKIILKENITLFAFTTVGIIIFILL